MGLDHQDIIDKFNIEGEIYKVEAFGNGLINKTFRLYNKDAEAPDYLMQQINRHVFPYILGMTSNLEQVTAHLRRKKSTNFEKKMSLTPIKTLSGELIYRTKEREYWRVFLFLKDCRSYDKAPDNQHVYEGAKAFGEFARDMIDFPVEKLNMVIPNFHHLGRRFEQLYRAKNGADPSKLSMCTPLIEQAELQYSRVKRMLDCIDKSIFPIRVTHNDTKFNNVLFRANGKSACVVDLDTTMPGIIHYDFGDGLRTGAVDCDEDENDLNKVFIDEDKFMVYSRGFLEPLFDTLVPIEIQCLPLAAPYMSLIMAVRFLTDYLNDDVYYHIEYPEQNFIRARCQLRLGELFYEKRTLLESLLKENR